MQYYSTHENMKNISISYFAKISYLFSKKKEAILIKDAIQLASNRQNEKDENNSDSNLNDASDNASDSSKSVPYMLNKSSSKMSKTGINFEAVNDCGYVFQYVPVSQD